MTHEPAAGNGNGRRWYDSTRVIWALFTIVGSLLTFGFMAVWNSTAQACAVNAAQDVRIERVQTVLDAVSARQDRMERTQDKMNDKLDELLRRTPAR